MEAVWHRQATASKIGRSGGTCAVGRAEVEKISPPRRPKPAIAVKADVGQESVLVA